MSGTKVTLVSSITSSRPGVKLLGLLALALVLRLLAVGFMPQTQWPDAQEYHALALDILHGQPYQVHGLLATRMPGYPVFIAAVYAVVGVHPQAVLCVQALLSTAAVGLVWLLARRLRPGSEWLAGLIACLDPLTIAFTACLLAEIPYAVVLLASLWCMLRILTTPQARGLYLQAVWLGILLMIGVYLRAASFYLAGGCLLLATVGLWRHGAARALGAGLLMLVIMLGGLAPWWQRNQQLLAMSPPRLTTLEGVSLYESVYAQADGGPQQDHLSVPLTLALQDEATRDASYRQMAWQAILADPLRQVRLAGIKLARTWSPWLNDPAQRNSPLQGPLTLWYIGLYTAIVLGSVGLWRRQRGIVFALMILPIVYYSLLHSLFLGSVRYRVPWLSVLAVLAGIGLFGLWQRLRRSPAGAELKV
ncbi:MAG: glycosyltransferase family 39 protein [Phycisphaerae bacterium]